MNDGMFTSYNFALRFSYSYSVKGVKPFMWKSGNFISDMASKFLKCVKDKKDENFQFFMVFLSNQYNTLQNTPM